MIHQLARGHWVGRHINRSLPEQEPGPLGRGKAAVSTLHPSPGLYKNRQSPAGSRRACLEGGWDTGAKEAGLGAKAGSF